MDRVAVKLEQDLAPMDDGNGEEHIIVDRVGACVASTLEEMEWNVQGKGIT